MGRKQDYTDYNKKIDEQRKAYKKKLAEQKVKNEKLAALKKAQKKEELDEVEKQRQELQNLQRLIFTKDSIEQAKLKESQLAFAKELQEDARQSAENNPRKVSNKPQDKSFVPQRSLDEHDYNFNLTKNSSYTSFSDWKRNGVNTATGVAKQAQETVLKALDDTQTFVDPSPIKPELQRGNRLAYYNNVKAEIDRAVNEEFRDELDTFNTKYEALKKKDESNDLKDMEVDDFGNLKANPRNRALKYKEEFDATIGLQMEKRKQELFANFNPFARNAGAYLADAFNENGLLAGLEASKNSAQAEYDKIDAFIKKNASDLNQIELTKYVNELKYLGYNKSVYERQQGELAEKADAVSRYIETFDLPEHASKLPANIRKYMQDLGNFNNWYDSTGKLIDRDDITKASDLPHKDDVGAIVDSLMQQRGGSLSVANVDAETQLKNLDETFQNQLRLYKLAGKYAEEHGDDVQYNYNKQALKSFERVEKLIELSKKHLARNKEIKEAGDGWFGGGFWTTQNWYNMGMGAYDVLSDKNTWLLDIPEMLGQEEALRFANKVESGARLTDAEQLLAQAFAVESYIHGNSKYEDVAGYKAGNVATESLKFMAETIITEGLTGVISKGMRASKFTMKQAVEANMKRLAEIYAEQHGKGTLGTFFGRQIVKIPEFGKLVGLQTGQSVLMANSIQFAGTKEQALSNQVGSASYSVAEDGTLVFDGFGNRMTEAEAWATAEGSMAIENLSEFSGEWGLGKIVSKPFKQFVAKPVRKLTSSVISHNPSLGKAARAIGNFSQRIEDEIKDLTSIDLRRGWNKYITRPSKAVNDVLDKAHVGGLWGEIGEEYNAMPMQRAYDWVAQNAFGLNTQVTESEYSLWDDINPFTEHGRQTFFDIAYGIALSQATFGIIGGGSYLNTRRKYNNAKNNAKLVFGDRFDDYHDALVNADTRNLSQVMSELYGTLNDSKEKKALFDYYKALGKYRGASAAMSKEVEDNNKSLQEQALEASKANGYTAQSNGLHKDLEKVTEIMHNNTLLTLDLTEEQLQQTIADYGSVESYAKDLYDQGMVEQAALLLAEERLKARQEGALKAISDTIQDRLDHNDDFISRITAEDGSVYVATDKLGNTVYITRGAHEVNSKSGKKVQFDKNSVVVDRYGNIKRIDGSELKDGEKKSVNELRRNTSREIYTEYINQFEKPSNDKRIGTNIPMGYNRFGTVLGFTLDGRVMYSVNDGKTEDIRFGELGQSIDNLVEQWDTEYNNEIAERELLGATRDLARFDEHKEATVTAADEVVEYMNHVRQAQQDDINNGKHGRGIVYAENKELDNKGLEELFRPQSKVDIKNGKLIGILVRAKNLGGVSAKNVALLMQQRLDILPDVTNLPRLERILKAWFADNLTDDELKYILTNGKHKINSRIASKLENILIDKYGNVQWGKMNKGVVTQIDPVSNVDVALNTPEIDKFEHHEAPVRFTNFFTPTEVTTEEEEVEEDASGEVEPPYTPAQKPNGFAEKIAAIIKSIEEHGKKLLNSSKKQSDSIKALLNQATRMHGRVMHVNDCNMFIVDDNGELQMYTNNPVNFGALFTERFLNAALILERQNLYSELQLIYNTKGIDAFRQKLEELGVKASANFSIYADYLNNHADALYDVCASVAMMSTLRKNSGGSLQAEATMHGLLEWLFNGHDVQDYEEATFEAEGVVVNVKDYMSKDAYEHAIDNYRRLIDLYQNTLDWLIIYNEDLVFTSDRYDQAINQVRHIATKPNLVAVDKNGKYHVINIATAWDYFDSRAKDKVPIQDAKGQTRGKETRNPVVVARTLGDQYSIKLTLDAEIIEENTGVACETIEMQPWRLDYYRRGDEQHQPGYIVDAENTTYEETRVTRAGGEYITRGTTPIANRIVLRRAADVQNRFVTEEQKEAQELSDTIDLFINHLSDILQPVEMRELDDDVQQNYQLQLQEIDDAINEYVEMFESGLFTHIDELQAIFSSIQDLLDERASLEERIEDENTTAMEDRIVREAAAGIHSSMPTSDDEYWESRMSEEEQFEAQLIIQSTAKFNQLYEYMMSLFNYMHNNGTSYIEIQAASYQGVMQYFADLLTMQEVYPNILTEEQSRQLFEMQRWFKENVLAEGLDKSKLQRDANLPKPTPKPKMTNTARLANSHSNGKNKVTGKTYVNVSTSVDQNGLALSAVIDDPDFVRNAEFEYVLDEDEKNANVKNPKLHIKITYNGSTFTPIAVFTSSEGSETFYLPIVAKLKNGERVFPNSKPRRIAGEQIKTERVTRTANEAGLTKFENVGNGTNVYDIEFDPSNVSIGITDTRTDANGQMHVYVVVPTKNTSVEEDLQRNAGVIEDRLYQQRSEHKLSDAVVVDEIRNGNSNITKGIFVFLKRMFYSETGNRELQQIFMRKKTVSVDDASFILDALLGKFNFGETGANGVLRSVCYVNNNAIQASILDFVDMLIPCSGRFNFILEQKYNTSVPHLDLSNLANGIVYLRGLDVNGLKDHAFNILNDGQSFVSFLSTYVNVHTSIRGFANNRFGSTDPAFRHINALEKVLNQPGSSIQFGNSSLVFDHDDFNHVDENGVKKPISGLGWYVKAGHLVTEYAGNETTQMIIDETAGFNTTQTNNQEDTSNLSEKEQFIQRFINAGKTKAEAEHAWEIMKAFRPKTQSKRFSGKTLDRKRAKEEILRIAGECGIRFSEDYLTEEDEELFAAMLQQDAHVVGKCYSDLILLSDKAADGIQYHEAFHRVLELLMSEKERQKVYNRFRLVHNLDASVSDNEVGEMIADQFMDYMMGRMNRNNGFINNLKNVINWIKLMRSIGSFSLYRTYVRAKNGKYANVVVTDEMRKRFNERTPYGHYNATQIHGMDLQHTLNMPHYNSVIDFFVYATIHCTQQNIKWDGSNITDFRLSRDLFETDTFKAALELCPEAQQLAINEMLSAENWPSVSKDVASRLSLFTSTPKHNFDEEHNESVDGQDRNEVINWYDGYDPLENDDKQIESAFDRESFRDSFEFSKFSTATEEVKFFFSGIIRQTFDQDGNLVNINNGVGLPSVMSTFEVFDMAITRLHDCYNIPELMERLEQLGKENPVFAQLSTRLTQLWEEHKKYRQDNGTFNADTEKFFSRLINSVRCANLESRMTKASKVRNGYMLHAVDVDQLYKQNDYINQWCESFSFGLNSMFYQDENENYVPSANILDVINYVVYHFNQLRGLANGTTVLYANSIHELYDPTTEHGVYNIKNAMCSNLNRCGIYISVDMLDEYLRKAYGNTGMIGFTKFIRSHGVEFEEMAKKINDLYKDNTFGIIDGKINGSTVEDYLKNVQLLKTLSEVRYAYERTHNQMSTRIADGATLYAKGENNLLSSVCNDLERNSNASTPVEKIQHLSSLAYNAASILLGRSMRGPGKFTYTSYKGFITDDRSDLGSDYTTMSEREDWTSKATLLLNGYFLFPTMSDKKTYGYIDTHEAGLMPGLSESSLTEDFVRNWLSSNEDYYINDAAVDQLIAYAKAEHEAVGNLLELICEKDGEGNLSGEINLDAIQYKVKNFHQGVKFYTKGGKLLSNQDIKDLKAEIESAIKAKDENISKEDLKKQVDKQFKEQTTQHSVVQGARYSSLLGVYENGSFISFNSLCDKDKNYTSPVYNYNLAKQYFFDARVGETAEETVARQRHQIREQLAKQADLQMTDLKRMGLIEEVNGQYKNVGLDQYTIGRYTALIRQHYQSIYGVPLAEERAVHGAIKLYVADINARHVISMNESERLLSGRLAFFKWNYDMETGRVTDMRKDWSKRLGGLVSTGIDNNMWIDGIENDNAEYTCAIVSNEKLPSNHLDEITALTYETEVKANLILAKRQELTLAAEENNEEVDEQDYQDISDAVDKMTLKEAKKLLENTVPEDQYKLILKVAENKSKAFAETDVADGAAYMSDAMCERLLRMVGCYDSKVQEAFRILRSNEITSKQVLNEAYQLVVTTVIGAQKYTAYGFRFENGEAVPYYDKMALFPIFKCMCTGNMSKIYAQMERQGIDILHVESAVKVGISDSTPIDWDTVGTTDDFFSVRRQRYADLRKQFNTDPKGEEMRTVGTQMTKVVMSALDLYKQYGDRRGIEIRDDIMNCINALSSAGYEEVLNEFFDGTGDNRTLNVEKFSNLLTRELEQRNAPFELIDAVSVIERQVDGKTVKDFKIPISALSSMAWLLSILTSHINKKVIDINMPGSAFYQRSVWGMEGQNALNIFTDEDMPAELNGGKKLEVRNEGNSMDCVLSIDFFEHILEKAKIKTGRKVDKLDKNGNVVVKKKYVKNDGSNVDPYEVFKYIYELHPEIHQSLVEARENSGEEGRTLESFWGTTTNTDPDLTGKTKNDFYNEALEAMGLSEDNVIEERVQVDETVSVSSLSFEQQKQWLIDNNIIGDNAENNIIGYRIPTQALSSIHGMRCVDVLPVVRDTVILPAEFTLITGSDFDIDKLFLTTKHYRIENHGLGKATSEFKEGSTEYYANRLVDDYMELLTDIRSFNQLNGSIDKDTEVLKDLDKELSISTDKQPLDSYSVFSIRQQVSTKNEFVDGKTGIGPFALNNNSHILTMLYKIKFTMHNEFLAKLGLLHLDHQLDKDGRSISSWLSGLINAHVDVAKDPYISRLNVNPYTYNLTNLLVRTGLGKRSFYFLNQPILKKLAEVYATAGGTFLGTDGVSKTERQTQAEHKFIMEYAAQLGWSGRETDKLLFAKHYMTYISNKYGQFEDICNVLFNQDNTFKTHATHATVDHVYSKMNDEVQITVPGKYTGLTRTITMSFGELQLIAYCAKVNLDKPAKKLADLVKYTKIDTKKQGKTLIEQAIYVRNYVKLFAQSVFKPTFSRELNEFNTKSYVQHKTTLATDLLKQILGSNFIEGTERYQYEVYSILERLHQEETSNAKIIDAVSKGVMAAIKSKWFFGEDGYCETNNIDPRDLFVGKDSIYSRLLRIKGQLMKSDDSNYVDADGNITNYLLKSLIASYKDNSEQPHKYAGYRFVRLATTVNGESIDGASIVLAWDEMLNDSYNPELLKFARDLVVYAYAVSGDTGGLFDLCKYVPNSFKENEKAGDSVGTFSEYMRSVTNFYNGTPQSTDKVIYPLTNNDYEDVILNNAEHVSGVFVPNYDDIIEKEMLVAHRESTGLPRYIMGLHKERVQINGVTINRLVPTPIDTPFFKLSAENEYGWRIYGIVDYGQIGGLTFPIYGPVEYAGRKFKGGYRIQEYGRNKYRRNYFQHDLYKTQASQYSEEDLRSVIAQANELGKTYIVDKMKVLLAAIQNRRVWGEIKENLERIIDTYFSEMTEDEYYDKSEQVAAGEPVSDVFDISDVVEDKLMLHTKDARYSQLAESEVDNPVLLDKAQQLRAYGYNVEFYTKHSVQKVKKEHGRETVLRNNTVMAISLPSRARKGHFELVQDDEQGYYSVHFKTKSAKVNKDSKWASEALTEDEKTSLFDALIFAIPDGGKVSTWGTLSKGGIHAIESLGERSRGQLVKTDEKRKAKAKREGRIIEITEDGSQIKMDRSIEIPVWLKGPATQTTTEEKPNNDSFVVTGDSKTTAQKAREIGGIDTLRHPDANGMHFGNPFSHTNYAGVQKVMPNVKEAVIAFEQWLRGTAYQDIEPQRRQWILDQINSGALDNKPIVYYTDKVPDNSYGRSTYDYNEAPNHAHILQKLINERKQNQLLDQQTIDTTISTLNSESAGLTQAESKSVVDLIGDNRPRVLIASETTDPVWHAKKIKEMVEEELKKQPKDRKFHMMYLITKHDGLPLRELAELKIPKFIHFSITSLGGTKYEPGVMKMDDLLDRIQALIDDKVLNPNLITIRIDPIIPGVTTKEDIEHIVQRATKMGIRQFKFSVMDSYGYTQSGEKSTNSRDRYIIQKMESLGYDWDTYYGRINGVVNFNAKNEYVATIYRYMDQLAQKYNVWFNTCGEQPTFITGLKRIRTNVGCVNVAAMNAAMGTTDIADVQGQLRKECSCYGNKMDALKYDDKCASSCVYCYAKHNSDAAINYYNEDGTLKDNRFTRTSTQTDQAKSINNYGLFSNDRNIMYHINPKRIPKLEEEIKKRRPDMSDLQINEAIKFLKSLPNEKENNAYVECCLRWIKNRTIVLPTDNEKVRQAFDYARKNHLDLQLYKSPIDLMIKQVKEHLLDPVQQQIDMSTRPLFKFNRTEVVNGNELLIYDVDDTEEGQIAVARLLHDSAPVDALGNHVDFSPWCLSTYHYHKESDEITMTESAKGFWFDTYNKGKRQIALHNGVPVAFNSSSLDRDQWWDFYDNPGRNDITDIDVTAPNSVYAREEDKSVVEAGPHHIRYNEQGIEREYTYRGDRINQLFSLMWFKDSPCSEIDFSIQGTYGESNIEMDETYRGTDRLRISLYHDIPELKDVNILILDLFQSIFYCLDVDFEFGEIKSVDNRSYSRIGVKKSTKQFDITIDTEDGTKTFNINYPWFKYFEHILYLMDVAKSKPAHIPMTNEDVELMEQRRQTVEGELIKAILAFNDACIAAGINDQNATILLDQHSDDADVSDPFVPTEFVRNTHYEGIEEEVSEATIGTVQEILRKHNEDVADETIQTAAKIASKDKYLQKYKELVEKPVNKQLAKLLHGILKDFNFEILEQPLNETFGEDVLGAFDVLQKIIYLAEEGDRNAITDAEEFSHAFIKMMGAVYHKKENRDRFPETKEYSRLRDLIEQTDLYKHTYELYKDVYKFENGNVDEPAIKEEALGKALAVVLNERFEKSQEYEILYDKIEKWFKKVLLWFKSLYSDSAELQRRLNNIADSVINGDYYEKYLQKIDDHNFKLQDYNETITESVRRDGGYALGIMLTISDLGGVISGSMANRYQGTIYRSDIDSLHDIDVQFNETTHQLSQSSPIIFNERYMNSLSREESQSIIFEALRSNPYTNHVLNEFTQKYPDARCMYSFSRNGVVITNWMICEDQSLVDRFMSMSGNFNTRMHHFTAEERSKMYLMDLFFNSSSSSDYRYIEDSLNGLKLADYRIPFKAKLRWSRAKDLYDYQHWTPNTREYADIYRQERLQLRELLEFNDDFSDDAMKECKG